MMKRLGVSALLLLGSVSWAQAQGSVPRALSDTGNTTPDFPATSGARATLLDSLAVADSFAPPAAKPSYTFAAPPLTTALPAEPATADPASPSPQPKFIYGGRDDYRWQLNLGFTWIHFRSAVFNADTFGLKTAVTYFLNDWLGVEGSFTGTFGATPTGLSSGARLGLYGGGPKIAWRQKRWEPWIHGIFGGAHEGPQAGAGSRNTYSIQAGGGADYRWNPRISFRAEGDYVRSGFFHQSQNSFELAGGIVFHF